MKPIPPKPQPGIIGRAIRHLQHAPRLRGALYLGTAVIVFQRVGKLQPRDREHDLARFHLTLLPCTALVTRAFAELREADRAAWVRPNWQAGGRAFLAGVGLGSAVLLSMLGIAAARGWVTAPAWGWAAARPQAVAQSVLINLVGQLAVAWNEETVYRGYIYDTWSPVFTPAGTATGLTLLFALAHPLRPQTLLGEATLGATLMLLRVAGNGIWASVGYHWAWNMLQTAVFGPADGPPSLRPLHVRGPHRWVGTPGQPDPGLLMTIVNTTVALGLGVWMWRRKRTPMHA